MLKALQKDPHILAFFLSTLLVDIYCNAELKSYFAYHNVI